MIFTNTGYEYWGRAASLIHTTLDGSAALELADIRGAFLPFPATRAAAAAVGDPRQPLAERYPSREAYVGRYTQEALDLVHDGLLLAEDLPEILTHAEALWQLVHADAAQEAVTEAGR